MCHANVNVDLIKEENLIQINGGITINVDMIVKKLMYVKKIFFYSYKNTFTMDILIK